MSVVKKFNNLKGEYTRGELRKIITEARKEKVYNIVWRLGRLLRDNPNVKTFTILRTTPKINATEASYLYGLTNFCDSNDNSLEGVSQDEIYNLVTDKIIDLIKSKKKLAWQNPIKSIDVYGLSASNFITKTAYKGINSVMLNFIYPMLSGKNWTIPYFLTFKQLKKLGGQLKKGSSGYNVFYYSVVYSYSDKQNNLKIKTNDLKKFISFLTKNASKIKELDGKTTDKEIQQFVYHHSFSIVKYYNVFNAEDITGINWKLNKVKSKTKEERIKAGELIVKHMPKKPKIKEGGTEAFYYPKTDTVSVPKLNNFKTPQEYYGTLFHELIHSTGVDNRLGRDMSGKFGSTSYAFEELIAEIGASFLNAESGILYFNIKNSAAYIKGWQKTLLKELENDNRFIFKASAKAQQAADFILARNKEGVPKYLTKIKAPERKKNNKVSKRLTTTKNKKTEQLALFGIDKTAKNKETTNFNKQIIKAKREGINKVAIFDLGSTKGILKKYIGKHKMLMSKSVTVKIMTKDSDHNLIWTHLINLPDKINNPIAIFNSKSKGFVILTELINHLKKPVVAIIHINPTYKIAKIASLYSKRQKTIYRKWEKEGLLIYKKKKRFETLLPAPIAASQTFKPQGKDTNKNVNTKKITKKNLGSIKINDDLFKIASEKDKLTNSNNTFRLAGEMGKFLQDLQRFRLAIVLTGDPHAGKSEFAKQMVNSFIDYGFTVGFFDLEQGGLASRDTRNSIDRNISLSNQTKLAVTGEAPEGIDTIKKYANQFDVVVIDSFQKLGVPNTRFDDLRIEHPNTIWIVIFQQNGEGGTRGGVTADYDAPIKIKVIKKDDTFVNNYAYLEKNRSNTIGLKYNVAQKKIIEDKPQEEAK